MELQFLGHACFLLDDGACKVLTDPFLSGAGHPDWAEQVRPDYRSEGTRLNSSHNA